MSNFNKTNSKIGLLHSKLEEYSPDFLLVPRSSEFVSFEDISMKLHDSNATFILYSKRAS